MNCNLAENQGKRDKEDSLNSNRIGAAVVTVIGRGSRDRVDFAICIAPHRDISRDIVFCNRRRGQGKRVLELEEEREKRTKHYCVRSSGAALIGGEAQTDIE